MVNRSRRRGVLATLIALGALIGYGGQPVAIGGNLAFGRSSPTQSRDGAAVSASADGSAVVADAP